MMDDSVSWCKTGLQELNSLAQDRRRWKLITRQAKDTNECWSWFLQKKMKLCINMYCKISVLVMVLWIKR